MRVRTAITAGLFDSGFAALAAFASSVYASRTFDVGLLGYYAVFLTAFLAASTIPGQLLFFPYEVAAVAQDENRLGFVKGALLRGAPVAVVSAALASSVATLISRDAPPDAVFAFAISMALAAALSPLQDHVRRVLHVDHRSRHAAAVSFLQFGGVLAFIALMNSLRVGQAWIPYLALAGANLVSLSFGIFSIGRLASGPSLRPPPFRSIARSGSWLLYISLLGPIVGLAVNAIVLAIAGDETLGFAEAARQAGRPLLVVTTGLGLALRPRSFAAAQRRRRSRARGIEKIFVGVTALTGGIYTAWVVAEWPLNLMVSLIPKAYEIGGLVLAVCISNIAVGLAFPSRYELIGAGREAAVAGAESAGQLLRVGVAGFTGTLGAFAIAVGDTALGLARLLGHRVGLGSLYQDGRRVDTGSERNTKQKETDSPQRDSR